MKKRTPQSDEFIALMAEKFRMLSDSTRLAILHPLMPGVELNVSQIVASTNGNVANVSKHLKQLADGNLLTRRKEGSFALYRMSDPVVEQICILVCESLKREIDSQIKRNRRILGRQASK